MDDVFYYDQFGIGTDGRTVSFDYSIEHDGDVHMLQEQLIFPVPLGNTTSVMAGLRALHLALGVSYYKIFVSEQITQPYAMTAGEADFWNDVWYNGLGEFMHVNDIAAERLAKFTPQTDGVQLGGAAFQDESTTARSAVLGIGGGKDSIVAGELLKSLEIPLAGFVMATGEQLGQAKSVAQTMAIDLHVIERRLDQQLLTLQERPDAYKGHVPISLIFGLVGAVLAAASGASDVVVANEASASIPRTEGINGAVNHQWSKSFEFEERLQRYIHDVISPGITYYSAIRPLTSVAVAKLFAVYQQYFEVFTSDNYVFRIDPARRPNGRWSLESPKSLSSFILLSPWLSAADMLRTFGRNFLDETSLETLFLELTGVEGAPPLDCVGTVEELIVSLNLCVQRSRFNDSYLLQLARQRHLISNDSMSTQLGAMLALQPDEALPKDIQAALLAKLQDGLTA